MMLFEYKFIKTRLFAGLAILLISMLWYFHLQEIADFIVFGIFKCTPDRHLTESILFFIYEVPKVMILLVIVVFSVGVFRSFFSPEKTRAFLEGKSLITGNVLASLLGIVTPFCSCSAVPLFIGFTGAGIPVGVTFSFLIAAPLVNEIALVLLAGMFGWQIAVIYTFTGLFIAITSGWIIEKLRLTKYVYKWVYETPVEDIKAEEKKPPFSERIDFGFEAVNEIVGKIWIYVLLGIAIGAGAHGYVPSKFLSELLGSQNIWAVPLAIVTGIPLYANAAGIIPIVSVLIDKGVSLGTALAFMMSVIGLSLPEIIILKKVLKWPLIMVFIIVVACGILIVGYGFNLII